MRSQHGQATIEWAALVLLAALVLGAGSMEYPLFSRPGVRWLLFGDEFSEALHVLLGDSGLRSRLGESGRRYVSTHYRWDVVLDRYRSLIAAASGP